MKLAWQLWEGALSPSICDRFVEECKEELSLGDGLVFSGETENINRKTKVGFTSNPEIKDCLENYLLEANRNVFGLNVDYMPPIQFAEYTEGSYYNWHHDIDWTRDGMYNRKLSACVQLSDSDSYEGGDFSFKYVESPAKFRTKGSVLVFPSYHEHRISGLTKGTRHSLVCWMEGLNWV